MNLTLALSGSLCFLGSYEPKKQRRQEIKYNELVQENEELKRKLFDKDNEIKHKNILLIDLDEKIKFRDQQLYMIKLNHIKYFDNYLKCLFIPEFFKFNFKIKNNNEKNIIIKLNKYHNKLNNSISIIMNSIKNK